MDNEIYDYTTSGFDNFLSRGLDDVSMTNLDSQGPISRQVAYDRNQVTGQLGDTLQIGNIHLNGADQNIVLSDGSNDRLLLGRQDGGF